MSASSALGAPELEDAAPLFAALGRLVKFVGS
jgi:hypothetical protein